MNRLFQDCVGEVKGLNGLKVKKLRVLTDKIQESNVILIWLQTEKSWLRIFVDCPFYCGIDEYDEDKSEDDKNFDDDILQNCDDWIQGLTIKNVRVECDVKYTITLTIEFTNTSSLVLKCDKNENCSLVKQ